MGVHTGVHAEVAQKLRPPAEEAAQECRRMGAGPMRRGAAPPCGPQPPNLQWPRDDVRLLPFNGLTLLPLPPHPHVLQWRS